MKDVDTHKGKRRFWIIAVVVMTISGAATALASIVLHFTEKGDDQYGCTPETLMMAGKFNTNMYCTREMAACNFLPKFIKAGERGQATVACNETVRFSVSACYVNVLTLTRLLSNGCRSF